ncbi:uncharacterized protein EI90DRAFT_3114511 [Cantharellus anzutake]|uniref:uncharacterized protein n=1 Tax=Cantharellus anzutake TaxID=1750568 RepID=UPI0019056DDC|nr:uncharacterized protein EI90DRAFT_3114511 [Cantharellus anzutake]KAF8343887.1 hypothetical protein EI90DRAFT_3114511 [Cantharellus anzutake]
MLDLAGRMMKELSPAPPSRKIELAGDFDTCHMQLPSPFVHLLNLEQASSSTTHPARYYHGLTTTMISTRPTIARRNLLFFLCAALLNPLKAAAFQLNLTTPHQCSNLTATWNGGTLPYELLLIPVGLVKPLEIRTIISLQNITTDSVTIPMSYPQGSQFIAVLSDATGAGTGGTTQVLTVGSPLIGGKGASSCLATRQPRPEFYFYLTPSRPTQCDDWRISWPDTVTGISIWAVMPGVTTFRIPLPSEPDPQNASLNRSDWIVNLPAGTQVLLVAGNDEKDGRGKGGSTDLFTVGRGTDSSCLNSNPLNSTSTTSVSEKPTGTTSTSTSTSTTIHSGAAFLSRAASGLTLSLSLWVALLSIMIPFVV